MLSLENSYNAEDLVDWDRKARELTGLDTIEYCVEPKFDGASISLIYENDLLVRGATRGDGVQGDEVTTNIKQIRSYPFLPPFPDMALNRLKSAGEVLMNKENFSKYTTSSSKNSICPPRQSPGMPLQALFVLKILLK